MKRMMNSKKRFGLKVGLVVLMVLCLSALSITTWGAITDYVGMYSGTYTGDNDGYWIAKVEDTGEMGMLAWSTTYQEMDGTESIILDDTNGDFNGTTDDGTDISGNIDDATSDMTGTWTNLPDSGTLSGTGFDSSSVSQFVGSYSGTFGGDDTGTWSMSIDSDGLISGTVSPSSSGGTYDFYGGINPDGRFFMIEDVDGDVGVFGTIAGSAVSGTWSDKLNDEGGSITGNLDSGGGDTGDTGDTGSGGGGCFISTLTK